MVKEKCENMVELLIASREMIDDIGRDILEGQSVRAKFLRNTEEANEWLARAQKGGSISQHDVDMAKSKFIDPLESMLKGFKVREERSENVEALFQAAEKSSKEYFSWLLDKLTECECGPGKELKEVQLKVPIMVSNTVETALKKSGYDVGTDAYYADPKRFVTVIVRPTKELELRSGE